MRGRRIDIERPRISPGMPDHEATMTEPKASGLEGVTVADTAISHVDGEQGRLVIAGSEVEQLAIATTYEVAAARVLTAGGFAISPSELTTALAASRARAWET